MEFKQITNNLKFSYLLNDILNTNSPIDSYKRFLLRKGGSIHIKKKNKGKFTEYCGGNVTLECINKGKNSSSPTIRKRATFADNARKWKHQNGGVLSIFRYNDFNNFNNKR